MSWLSFLNTQCPALYHLITDRTGQVDQKAVERLMEHVEPCNENKADCLERQCSALWQYYVTTRHKTPEAPREVRNIADHLFSERGNLSFRPGDLSFLYDLQRSTTDDQREHRIVRRSGQTVLRVENETDRGDVQGFDVLRFLLAEHPVLKTYFVNIYALERSVKKPIKIYLLMEAMDGSLVNFRDEFAPRDPHFWHRFTRMLLHGWVGLYRLHNLGYALGHVSLDNLLFKMEWNAHDQTAGLLAVKWRCPRGLSTEPARQHEDWVLFARMICQLMWGPDYELSAARLQELRDPNHLQPLSTLASHVLAPDNPWRVEQMRDYLHTHAPVQDVLDPVALGQALEVYPDW